MSQSHGWEKEEEKFSVVADYVTQWCELVVSRDVKGELYSAKTALRGVVAKSRDVFGGSEMHERLIVLLETVTEKEKNAV